MQGNRLPRSPEWKAQVSAKLKGRRLSDEHKERIRQAALGRKRAPFSEDWKRKIGLALKGRKLSPREVDALRKRMRGNKYTLGLKGPLSGAWRGGTTTLNELIRNSPDYKRWRQHVFQRDNYTCQACGQHGGYLHADHELPFSQYPALRFEVLNGGTLCVKCHRNTPTWGHKAGLTDGVLYS